MSFLEHSGKSVEVTVLEHFWIVFHPIKKKKAEEISEAKLRKNNFSGCWGEMTAKARTVLVLSQSFGISLPHENPKKCSIL